MKNIVSAHICSSKRIRNEQGSISFLQLKNSQCIDFIMTIHTTKKRLRAPLAPQEQLYTHHTQRQSKDGHRSRTFVLHRSTITPTLRKNETPSRHRSPPAPRRRTDRIDHVNDEEVLSVLDVFDETTIPHSITAAFSDDCSPSLLNNTITFEKSSFDESSFHESLHKLFHKLPKPKVYRRQLYLDCGPPKEAHLDHCERWFTMNPQVAEMTTDSSPPTLKWQKLNLEREELKGRLAITANLILSVLDD